jgi:hypothetical protein
MVGLGLSGLTVAFLAVDAAGKLLVPDIMIAHTPPIGLPADPAVDFRLELTRGFHREVTHP